METVFTGAELYYLRGLLNARDPNNGYALRLSEARDDDRGLLGSRPAKGSGPTLSQVLLRHLEQERQDLPRWGVDYSDLATKIDRMPESALRDLYDNLQNWRFDVRCDQPSTGSYEADARLSA